MKKLSALGAVFVATALMHANAQLTYVGTLNQRDWYVSSTYVHPYEARTLAATLPGGTLASIRSAEEQAWVNSHVSSSTLYWIGLNDHAVEGQFVWDDGAPLTYTNWGLGEPSNSEGLEDDVIINWGGGGAWNDWKESDVAGALVTTPVPEPAPLAGIVAGGLSMVAASRRSRKALA